MFELEAGNVLTYLEGRGIDTTPARVTTLGGGVSNGVFLVESGTGRFVLKQALEKLRVEADWRSDRERVFRESLALERLAPHLPAGSVPGVLFEDRANFLFAMTAAPAGTVTWKTLLLAGPGSSAIPARIARLQSAMIRVAQDARPWKDAFGDQTVFDQLRLDPYYRTTAARHPAYAPYFERAIGSCRERACALVHGDWSPKNFLVGGDDVMAIDFEVIHFGNPAFDTAFLLNHLLLKSLYRPELAGIYTDFARTYWEALERDLPPGFQWLERATIEHLGCLLLARIDGKSPVEYLREETVRQAARELAFGLLTDPPGSVAGAFERLPR